MTGYTEFAELFGGITLLSVMQIILAGVFLYFVYKKVKDYLITKHDSDQEKDEQLKEALYAVRQYPEYRQQSIEIQRELKGQIQELKDAQHEQMAHLTKMEEDLKRRERSKLRDRLLQSYRYYTDKEKNVMQAWTTMESEAFWEVFGEYEEAGGDGHMHTVVQPEMNLLRVIDIDDAASVAELMRHRK